MNCPKCQSVDRVKNGKFKEVQKYKFKGCGCQYTRSTARGRPLEQKLLAITLYLHGLSITSIAKIFGVSAPGVLDWIHRYARKNYEKLEPQGDSVVLELDEMWHYLEKKRESSGSGKCWILLQDSYLNGNVVVEVQKP